MYISGIAFISVFISSEVENELDRCINFIDKADRFKIDFIQCTHFNAINKKGRPSDLP